jgi:BA14K-like protein
MEIWSPGSKTSFRTITIWRIHMHTSSKIIVVALMTAAAPLFVSTASALPVSSSLALRIAVAPGFEAVRYRSRGYVGAGIGLAAGAIIGGAILNATQPRGYYGYDGGYGYGAYGYEQSYSGYEPDYAEVPSYRYGPGPGPAYRQSYVEGGNDVGYCQQRYRSYDPASGTYLGYDGLRHPC